MKIGIFGDSYADTVESMVSWPCVVGNTLNTDEIDFHAQSGTSMWWAYQKFKKNYRKYDVIVFSFTTASRWPSLPEELEVGRQFNIGYHKTNTIQDMLNPLFFSLFPEELRSFLNSSIHREVVETCEREGKYLVQMFPFLQNRHDLRQLTDDNRYDFTPYPNKFPLLSATDYLSHCEEVTVRNERMKTAYYITHNTHNDHRPCHLNTANNKVVADWVVDCIRNKKYNIHLKGEEYPDWVLYDPSDSTF